MTARRAIVGALALAWAAVACQRTPPKPPPRATTLGPAAIARLIVDDDVDDPEGWARDVARALDLAGRSATPDHVCQVLAIIEQESGYQADPVVPNLGAVVAGEVDKMMARLGPAAGPVRAALLDHTAPGASRTFDARLQRVRTEAQADRLYREIVAFHRARHPGLSKMMDVVAPDLVERHNPITTAGSMQVSVSWSIEQGRARGLDAGSVRDLLYSRPGGVQYGTLRLFATADYTEPIHRFADFNAGPYAARNAGLQARITTLTGIDLVRDGDVLAYHADGRPKRGDTNTLRALYAFAEAQAPHLTPSRIRRDARLEKSAAFEDTPTWKAISAAFEAKLGRPPAEAILPRVDLVSPKFTRPLTTQWFAENTQRRYAACRARAR